jgi:hypothetical protein
MVKDIDKSEVIGPKLTYDYMGDAMSTDKISGGVKSLIMLYKCPNVLVNGNSMGDNCAKWFPVISNLTECYMASSYGHMISKANTMNDSSPFICEIINTGKIVHTIREFYREYGRYLSEVQDFPDWKYPYDFFFTFKKLREGKIQGMLK